MNKKTLNMLPCYFTFFANGMTALVIGAILPYLIEEAGISYSVAGGFIAAGAVGNLLASFAVSFLTEQFGRKKTTVSLTALIPVCFLVITWVPSTPIMYVSFVLLGMGKGAISILGNMVVNENDGRASAMNLLHMTFAIGAFIAPLLTMVFVNGGLSWKFIIYAIMVLAVITTVVFAMLPDGGKHATKKERAAAEEKTYLKSADFYIIALILFFYSGAENCVNGWFVTYFKSSGIMSDTYATNLVSVTWFMIMIGRVVSAYASTKLSKQKLILLNGISALLFFLLLISTHTLLLVTIAVAGLGFSFAGIYPTCVSNASVYMRGSTTGMSIFLAIAGIGGIAMPQLLGIMADMIGISGAVGFLFIDILIMVTFAIINLIRYQKKLNAR